MVTGIAHGRCRLPPAFGCPVRLPQLVIRGAEVAQGHALAMPVAGLLLDCKRLPVAVDGLSELPQPLVAGTEIVQRLAFAMPVAGLLLDCKRLLVAVDGLRGRLV